MSEILGVVAKLSIFTFIITSMLAMGMSLTVSQIIAPLKNVKVVLLALLANFVLVPGLAYGLTLVIPLPEGLATGLIISGAAAGAPFLPKLVQLAKGNAALSVGLMTLLMVVTVIYLPLVLPFMLPGASVSPWDIAKSLILMMLLPLAIGLFIKARYVPTADHLQPDFWKDFQRGHYARSGCDPGVAVQDHPRHLRHRRHPGRSSVPAGFVGNRHVAGRQGTIVQWGWALPSATCRRPCWWQHKTSLMINRSLAWSW